MNKKLNNGDLNERAECQVSAIKFHLKTYQMTTFHCSPFRFFFIFLALLSQTYLNEEAEEEKEKKQLQSATIPF